MRRPTLRLQARAGVPDTIVQLVLNEANFMSSRLFATTLAAIALAMLGACEQKAPEPPAQKSAADDAAKKAAAAPAARLVPFFRH